jgi:2-methylisocitrate lyase-like PEP mutase family enzyme
MVEKIRVACDARQEADGMLVIARTDAIAVEGFDAARRRAEAYGKAGADILFVEAPRSEEQMRTLCRGSDKPMLANMVEGGKTPLLSADELREIGYAGVIFPASTALAANAAMDRMLKNLKERGTSVSPDIPLYDFTHFGRINGFDEVYAFEAKWLGPKQ